MRTTLALRLPFFLLVGGSACVTAPVEERVGSTVQGIRAATDKNGKVLLGFDLLNTDESGRAFSCAKGSLKMRVRTSSQGKNGPFTELPQEAFHIRCVDGARGDLALVVDNSGSERGYSDVLKTAARAFVDRTLPSGGRASLVRVSTEAKVVSELSGDAKALHGAIDGLGVRNGWTALYDGIRIANETLGVAAAKEPSSEPFDGPLSFCDSGRKRAIVAFTDGFENNSGGEKLRRLEDDGIDTKLGDIERVRVKGVATPIYTVGLGNKVDHGALTALAKSTGGRYFAIDSTDRIKETFETIADYVGATRSLCIDVPDAGCGSLAVKLDWSWSDGGTNLSGEQEYETEVACPARASGRVATMLLTLSAPGIPSDVAGKLAAQAVDWVSPKDIPRVLVVQDDGHHGEFVSDTLFVKDLLVARGVDAKLLAEPKGGLSKKDVDGFDVVWMSNPGYPIDDDRTLVTLGNFSGQGGGVILQGDDMAQSWAKNASMAPFTHLDLVDNGTSTCGALTNDNKGEKFWVTLGSEHPIVKGIEGTRFTYGDDIDLATARNEGETILATAYVGDASGKSLCDVGNMRPVLTAYDPPKKP